MSSHENLPDGELLRNWGRCPWQGLPYGEYTNQVTVVLPWEGAKVCGIDACIVPEIKWLWDRNIETIESCCGHGTQRGYILVQPENARQMRKLGYETDMRTHADNFPNAFLCKTHYEDFASILAASSRKETP